MKKNIVLFLALTICNNLFSQIDQGNVSLTNEGKVKYKNIRFSPELTSFNELAKQMAKDFGYTAKLKTDDKLAELIRLRVAQKNECAYCVVLHAEEARKMGIPQSKVDNISSWYNSLLFSDKEKAALAYSDALTIGTDPNFQTYHDVMLNYFSEAEIADIAAIIINMNVWTRFKLASGAVPYYE